MYIELVRQFDKRKKTIWQDFLKSAGLSCDEEVKETVLLWEDDCLIGAGSRDGSLLKLIAISPEYQGEDLTAKLLSELKKGAFSEGYNHLFLYTKPENEKVFHSLFFYTVAKTENVLLMENRKNGINDFLTEICAKNLEGTVGAIVMNANPFTLGHRYLIETSSKKCDNLCVFVVSEEKSRFSAKDRIEMVKLGTEDIENVTVLPTGPYLVSSATFPTYFLKEREKASKVQCFLDVEIFLKYFVPKFSIDCRFVGTEPLSPMTNEYNKALKLGLEKEGIKIFEIPRIQSNDSVISASKIRELLDKHDIQAVKSLVPSTTFEYLAAKGFLK